MYRLARTPAGGARALRDSFRLRGYQIQELYRFGKIPGFLVIEKLGSIFEYLQLPGRTGAHLHLNPFFGSCFAQAHGRAAQVESKQAASNFNHASFLQIACAARIVFT